MGASTSSKDRTLLGLPMDVVLTSLIALLLISIVVLGDLGIAAQIKPGAQGQQGPDVDDTKWVLTDVELYSNDGYTAETSTTEVDAGGLPENTTKIKIELSWTDDYGSNDVFELELQIDGKTQDSQQGTTGSLSIETDAANGENLTGNLTVLVTCVNSPGIVGPNPFHVVDKGNSWTLKATATVREKE